MKPGFIYILANKNNTTLYIGVTSDLPRRILEHKQKKYKKSFSAMYNLEKLVYWEAFQEIGDAIVREKQLKAGSRQKKLDLINNFNPQWRDLYDEVCAEFTFDNGFP
ncbi:GIY-YIG nuclease family protein [Kaistella sp. 97-N-M2]|uniref:GIY-YIG nuclease family protein n=1 Tax=Kaistella sp. 97-N-M2 TaxID=2908645 RepID=UPI001F253167|nr:GIY-YIG nuclease family protein [Kaistella sp. 97-N-M2]UJF30762.1 GIY-YIG nuclease family protein [Kaistella sp. 97-N-M2]